LLWKMESLNNTEEWCSVDLETGAGGAISPLGSVDDVSSTHRASALTVEPRRHAVLTEYVLHTHTHRHLDTHAHKRIDTGTHRQTVRHTVTNTHTHTQTIYRVDKHAVCEHNLRKLLLNNQCDHSPDNVKFPDGSRQSAC